MAARRRWFLIPFSSNPDRVQVLFAGHDGVFRLKRDHPGFDRLRALLGEAVRENARVWFIAQKRDLALLDVLPTEPSARGTTSL